MHIEIGYTYAIVDVFNKGEKIGEIYYGVCNKTKKWHISSVINCLL